MTMNARWLAMLAGILTLAVGPARADAHPGAGIVVDRNGTVYFVVFGSSHLMKWRPGEKASVFVSDDRIRLPHHLTYGRDGFIYVVSDDDGRVFRIDSAGRLHHDASREWRIRGDSAEAIVPRGAVLESPAGIALDDAGNIYVADVEAKRVVRLAPDGAVNTPAYLADVKFRGPTGVAVRGDTVYVLDNAPGSTAVWRIAPDDSGRVYTQSFWKWHLRTMVAGLPILLVTMLVADRYQRRTSVSKPAS